MVRTKLSWILVRFDFEESRSNNGMSILLPPSAAVQKSILNSTMVGTNNTISGKDIYTMLRESISHLYGPVGYGQTTSIEGTVT
jgi:hypothetical protein